MNGFIATFYDESPATRIMRLVERHCPRLMREGGGSLRRECETSIRVYRNNWKRVTKEERALILALGREGMPRKQICAEAKGVSQTSVYRILESAGVTVWDGRDAANQSGRREK